MKKLNNGWYQIGKTGWKINPKRLWLFECEVFTITAFAIFAYIKVLEMIFR